MKAAQAVFKAQLDSSAGLDATRLAIAAENGRSFVVFIGITCSRFQPFRCRIHRSASGFLHFAEFTWDCHVSPSAIKCGPSSEAAEMPMSANPDVSLPADPALLRVDGSIATITLNRPDAFNSIDLSIAKKLEQLSAEVEASADIRVLVIEGEGRAFCAGGDLKTIGAAAAADEIAPVVGELLQHYHAFITTLRRMPKIVLASVHGSAAGAGLSLAFVADLCIAAEDARFTPAYSKLGVSPDGGGTVGLAASVGARRALQIFLAEDSFTAAQAHQWGLVTKVVVASELKAATRELAVRLAQNAPGALAATKALIHRAPVASIQQQLDAERDAIIACMQTDEFRAAVKKFTGKQK